MLIKDYFTLTPHQEQQFAALDALYRDWNSKINVISRKDIDALYTHHVLHSLAIARVLRFQPGTAIMDVGTGGGFPGIPLAILFPECEFLLVDSVKKKVLVASEVAKALGLNNVECVWERVEDERRTFDFVVSRGVMPLPDLVKLTRKNIDRHQRNAMPNGWLVLKGGDLRDETKLFRTLIETTPIADFFQDEWYREKYVLYLPN
jgi:16S rRNA (guanine527-N7)-methyltransferase